MSFAASPDLTVRADSFRDGFYALAMRVDAGILSKRVNEVRVIVLSGAVDCGDAVELGRADRAGVRAVVRGNREDPFMHTQTWILLDNPRPLKSDVGDIDVVRTPGLQAPRLSPEDVQAGARLLEAIRAARRYGFPNAPLSRLGLLVRFPLLADLCELFRRLPDEAVLLTVQKQIRFALAPHVHPEELPEDCWVAAECLEAIGLREDGNRLLLAAAAALQGHPVSQSARALEPTVTRGAFAPAQAAQPGAVVSFVGSAVGGGVAWDAGAQWAARREIAGQGRKIETAMLTSGRGVGIGWCKRCRGAVRLDVELRCPNDHKRAEEAVVVVPSDAASTGETLQRRHGVGS